MVFRLPLARGLMLSTLVLFAADCSCRKSGGLNENFGEIGVVWRDDTGAQLVGRDATYNFGAALSGQTKTMIMTVRNVGSAVLTLSKLEVASGDTATIGDATVTGAPFAVKFTPKQINPTEQVEFEMTFSPQALKSSFESKLTLTAEGARPEDATATITLKGGGEKGACELPDTIDFGNVPLNETYRYTIEMNNPTTLVASATAGDITGNDAQTFGYASDGAHGTFDVQPNTTTKVIITFTPTEKRPYSAQVVAHGAGTCADKTIAITGSGSDLTLTWAPSDLAFGFVNPGESADKDVTFTNPSNVPITLTQITSSMPADFYQDTPAGVDDKVFVVPGGAVPTPMHVACTPSSLGARQGRLTFVTGLRSTPSGTITLSCTGGGPKIKVTPRPTLGFGKVGYFPGTPSFSVNRKVTIQNVGGKPPTPDVTANLFLGQVVDRIPGQGAPYELTPGPGTSATEFTVGLASMYDAAKGIEAVAGSNYIDLLVTLKPTSVGMKSAKLTLYSNDAAEPAITLDLTADAQTLPPCSYEVTPSMVDFGLVTPGQNKDLPVRIKNKGIGAGETCSLSGIDLAAGTSPAFSIVGGPITEKTLGPQETLEVVVRLTPPGAVPSTLETYTGVLRFNSTSPSQPQGNVQLKANIGPSCIAVTPDPQDFGTVKIGCNSNTRTFNIYNVCDKPVGIGTMSMQSAGGQPAGGPNCPGGGPCPEFFLTSSPQPNTTLDVGSAPLQFQARYRPIDVSADTGAISMTSVQLGQSVSIVVGLLGNGDNVGQQTDTFKQDLTPKADILIVIDDSGSMQDKQSSLASNFNSFIKYAASANVDYQIGVVSTTVTEIDCEPGFPCIPGGNSGPVDGILFRDGVAPILTPRTHDVAGTFAKMVNLGTDGASTEAGLAPAVLALTPPLIAKENAGFLRPEANLAVVVVSDAGDQSPQPVAYYQNRLINIKGFNRLSMFTFNNIGPYNKPTMSCAYDGGGDVQRYAAVVTATSGVKDEICTTDWATALQGLGKTAFGYRTQFFLNNTPDQGAGKLLQVRIDGVDAPATGWSYDSMTNSIKFVPTAAPTPGQTLTVKYDTQCF